MRECTADAVAVTYQGFPVVRIFEPDPSPQIFRSGKPPTGREIDYFAVGCATKITGLFFKLLRPGLNKMMAYGQN